MSAVCVLGPVEARSGERRLALGGPQQVKLFAFLVLHANRAVSADALVDAVWGPERDGAVKRLHMAVARLRRALEPLDTQDGSRLRTVSGGYLLSIARGELDVDLFEDRVRDGRRALTDGDAAQASGLLGEALALWRGPPFAEVSFEDFAQADIRRLEELRLAALEARIDADLLRGRGGELVAELEALIATHPEREHVAGQLMRALYAAGRQAEALEVYQRTRGYLMGELGLEPGPELQAIQADVLGHAPGLSPPPATPGLMRAERGRAPGLRGLRLPRPAGRLIGREHEVRSALEVLEDPEARLVTLLGVGGAGKTRLAIEIATRSSARYRDGAWLVLLASVTDAALVAGHIARAVGVDPVAGQPIEQALVAALADRELLLILDNLEHLLDAVMIVSELLAAAPGVDVLVTSREPLHIAGEQRIDVPPLELAHARELFVARARAVRRDLALDQDELSAIDAICQQLDGLPLALELAAARTAVFSPRALHARLTERLSLASRERDTPERHGTLRATLDWSFRLLSSAEQAALTALAPFIGGVRVDAAEQIWGGTAVETLAALTEKSLLRRREDPDGETRFWMLETIREYALEQAVSSGRLPGIAEQHALHQVLLSDRAAVGLEGPEQRYWLERIEHELPNVRGALEHLIGQGAPQAVQLAANLTRFWEIRSYQLEAKERLQAALDAAPPDSPHYARALGSAATIELMIGEPGAAVRHALAALERLGPGETRLIERAHCHLGRAKWVLGDEHGSCQHHREAIEQARAAADGIALAHALEGYAIWSPISNDAEQQRALFEEVLRLRRLTPQPFLICIATTNLGYSALLSDELDTAQALIEEAHVNAQEIDCGAMLAGLLGILAEIALARGDADEAALHTRQQLDGVVPHDIISAGAAIYDAGTILAAKDKPILAATLWAAADRMLQSAGSDTTVIPFAARLRARREGRAQAMLGDPAAWEAAHRAGARLSAVEAVSLATEAIAGIVGHRSFQSKPQ